MKIVRARTSSIATINAVICASKSVWDYSADYLREALPLLQIDETYLTENITFEILDKDDQTIGFFAITEKDGDRYIDHLWIKPSHLRVGTGRMACEFIFQLADKKGWNRLFVLPDPPARGFYENLGFENTGQSIASRVTDGPIFYLYRKIF